MIAEQGKSTVISDREAVFTRHLDAPRQLVFEALTDPEHIVKWFGPDGFSTTIQQMDLRPGGVWRFVLHGPDGTGYKNRVVFNEIVPPQRLVYTHAGEEGEEDVHIQVTVTLDDQNGGTRLTFRQTFDTAEEFERVAKQYGAIEGAEQTLTRLEQHVAGLQQKRRSDG